MGASPKTMAVLTLLLAAFPASAQEGKINTRVPPPPPPPEEIPATRSAPPALMAPQPPMPPAPAVVSMASGTIIAVVLDTPLSTRISKKGQRVSFRTSHWVPLTDGLELPPETEFVGIVVDARRPGAFGKPGTLQVKLERIELPSGANAPVTARLESPDADKQGKISADKNSRANVADLAQWAVLGTLGGWQVAGGKGAGYGAAAGAAIGLIILMSHKGPDLYLEPGMPFTIVLNSDASLPGADVQAAQRNYARNHGYSGQAAGANGADPSAFGSDGAGAVSESERPKLKRRPKNP